MLKKKLTVLQWISLLLLCIGVVCVQLQPVDDDVTTNSTKSLLSKPIQRPWLGFLAGVVACIMTGFAGIYFEKILKSTPQSIFIRNIQLGVIGIVVGLITVGISDGASVQQKGFFYGYDVFVWAVVVIHGVGGIIVAAVQKYADNILKGFAASGAIVIAAAISIYVLDFHLSAQFIVGSFLVIVAIYMYSKFIYRPPSLTAAWVFRSCRCCAFLWNITVIGVEQLTVYISAFDGAAAAYSTSSFCCVFDRNVFGCIVWICEICYDRREKTCVSDVVEKLCETLDRLILSIATLFYADDASYHGNATLFMV